MAGLLSEVWPRPAHGRVEQHSDSLNCNKLLAGEPLVKKTVIEHWPLIRGVNLKYSIFREVCHNPTVRH